MLIQVSIQVSGKFSSDLNTYIYLYLVFFNDEFSTQNTTCMLLGFFSGELIGIDYLFNQTGNTLEIVGA